MLELLAGLLLGTGILFTIAGSVGLLRFPDFYTRLHAAGVTETLGMIAIVAGLMLHAGTADALVRLALIGLFMLATAPIASPRARQSGPAPGPAAHHRRGRRTITWHLISVGLLAFMLAVALAVALLRNLFAAVMLFAIYSLSAAALFVTLDAVDVAFTEAAVGAGISSILMLATLAVTGSRERPARHRRALPLVLCLALAVVLLAGVRDLAPVGDPGAPPHTHVAPEYLSGTAAEIGVPNVVTAVLASYRGYDTLGEAVVIFTAGLGVAALLGGRLRRRREGEGGDA